MFVSLTCCGGLTVPRFCGPKVRLEGERVTIVPEPETSMTCGLVEALSTIEIVPAKVPWVAGEKVRLRLQLAPGATLLPQVELTPYRTVDYLGAWVVLEAEMEKKGWLEGRGNRGKLCG